MMCPQTVQAKHLRTPFRIKRRAVCQGNTLIEYILSGALILGLTISVILAFSTNLNKAFAALRDEMRSHRNQTQAAILARQSGGSSYTGLTNLSPQQLALLQSDLSTKLQTTGANGSTELFSQQIALSAQQMLDAGKIDQNQYDLLMKLANQGHQMAQIEGMIADAVQYAGGDLSKLKSLTYSFNGQNYTAIELSHLIGFVVSSDSQTDLLAQDPSSAGSELSNFMSLYNQALNSGIVSTPELQSTVNSAAYQIASLGEITEENLWRFSADKTNLTSATDLNNASAESATHINSGKICAAGDFLDNGVLCKP